MTNLNTINTGENKYCGPAVLSAICGISTDEAEKVINSVTNHNLDRRVTGVWNHELNAAFESLGWKAYQIPGVGRKSIFSLMYTMSAVGIYLFYLSSHVVAIEISSDGKRYLIDNQSKKPLNLSNSARLGQKVVGVVKLERK